MFGGQVKISFKWKIGMCAVILSAGFLTMSCNPNKAPEHVLSEQEMVRVLAQLLLSEEKVGRAIHNRDSAKVVFKSLEAKIFESQGTHDSIFKMSMEYYLTQPTKLEHIYSALVDSLNLKVQSAPSPVLE